MRMPSYNYICKDCGEFTSFNSMANRALSQCPNCGTMAKQTVCSRPPAVHRFKYGVFENITSEPVFVRGKKHLQELCDKHDCYAPGALD